MKNFSFAVLLSGNGSNLKAMIKAINEDILEGSICCVLCNNPKAYGIERAKQANIPSKTLNHKDFSSREEFDLCMIETLKEFKPDLIVLAGFMRILSSVFVQHYLGRLINIHPSLLPRYPGLNTHKKVLTSGDKFHGITIHFVDETLDGGPICAQSSIEVQTKSETELKNQIHLLEHKLYPKVINWFGQGRLKLKHKKAFLDGREINIKK